MTLVPGTRLGPYEILAPLGAGGMGEVHRARDSRLGRDVAIKALPPAFAQDAERLARFEREARLLASLNHPNVAGIHGLEDVAGTRYLVLEFVDGETLADRIARGALPVDEAVEVCRQVAAGVEAAHEAGVVHRDLKPGNIMLKADGSVKVLDFGLAKTGGSDRPGSDADMAQSPTMTFQATSAGVVLGTAAYMSPEQARGRAVDKRSDVWSFGCVLYECLTARQAFHGETVSDTIAAILKTDADMTALPADTPPRLRELLARCLTKDPRDRLRDIGEARVILTAVAAGIDTPAAGPGSASPASRGRGVPLGAAIAAALVLAALGAAAAWFTRPAAGPAAVRRLDLVADGIEMDWFFTPTLSPDGRRIAYIAHEKLWLRDLEQLEPREVADVGGLTPLCWSPDSRTLVYDDAGKLSKVAVDGGVPQTICVVPGTANVIGIAVSPKGVVAFSVWRGGMYQVPLEGGAPTLLFDVDPDQMVDYHSPTWLSGGRLLHVVHWRERADSTGKPKPVLALFDGGRRTPIAGDIGSSGAMPTLAGDRLLYVRRDASAGIWALPFDAAGARVTGKPELVAAGAGCVSVSVDGSLLYMESSDEGSLHQLVWVDRGGKVVETVGEARPGLSAVALSPDGRRVAFTATSKETQSDIWVRDLGRGIDTRITFDPGSERNPNWIGSSRLSYVQTEMPGSQVFVVNADGSGGKRLLASEVGVGVQQALFSPDGTSAIRIIDDAGHGRLRRAALLPDGALGPPEKFLQVEPEPDIGEARFCADGRLVAYDTDDPGQPEVFLARYPSGEGRWQVSQEGARRPRWAATAGALYYIAGGGPSRRWLVEVKVDPGQDPPVGTSTKLFDIDPRWLRFGEMPYDVASDGSRFLMARDVAGGEARPDRMILVQNWEAGLAKTP
jgi:serine/threonine-protein kinase